ncbi:hypothetical protein Tsubulata_049267, partial [Turnera subulata]
MAESYGRGGTVVDMMLGLLLPREACASAKSYGRGGTGVDMMLGLWCKNLHRMCEFPRRYTLARRLRDREYTLAVGMRDIWAGHGTIGSMILFRMFSGLATSSGRIIHWRS